MARINPDFLKKTASNAVKKRRQQEGKARMSAVTPDSVKGLDERLAEFKANKHYEEDFAKELEKEKAENKLKYAAEKNEWSVEDQKEYNRLLKEEEKQKQREGAKARENPRGKWGTEVPKNKDGNFEFNRNQQQEDYDQKQKDLQAEAEAKKLENQEKIQKAGIEEKEEENKIKTETDAKIEDVTKNGIPLPWYVAIFTTTFVFFGLTSIDSFTAIWPAVGDFGGFIILLILWSIPCVALLNFKPLRYIVVYLIFDVIFGLVFGSLANVIPVVGEFVVDLIPELILFFVLRNMKTDIKNYYPPNAIKQAVDNPEAIERKIKEIKENAANKIKDLRAGLKSKRKSILNGRRLKGSQKLSTQKTFFFILLMVLIYVGPLSKGWISISLEGRSLLILGVVILLLYLLSRLNWISIKQFAALIIFVGFMSLIKPLLASNILSGIGGAGADGVIKIVMIILMIILTFFFSGIMAGKTVVTIFIFILLGLSGPFMFGAVSNHGRMHDQQLRTQAKLDASIENANLIEKISTWFKDQIAMGKGENIQTSSLEQTSKFIGVKISDIRAITDAFYVGHPIMFKIAFDGFVYRKTTVRTVCRAGDYEGTVVPQTFDLQKSVVDTGLGISTLYPEVTCEFKDLPKGIYSLEVMAFYPYQSTVDIPLRLMSYDKYIQLSAQMLDEENPQTMEEYTGGKPQIITSSGPIIIHPSNAQDPVSKQKIYSSPTIVDLKALENNTDRAISYLSFQAKKSSDDQNGEVQSITQIKFDLPEGMNIKCNGINNFKFGTREELDGQWSYTFKKSQFDYDLRDIISCELYLEKDYVDQYFGYSDWTTNTIFITMDYNYQQKKLYDGVLEVI